MISTISPSFDNYEETLSTLRYADRAKRIVNNAIVNEDPNAKIIRNLREELETLKKELEIAKEKISKDAVKDKLNESEKLYNEFSKTWSEKLAETEKIQQEYNSKLQSLGISVQSSGIKVEKEKFYLVNLNADPSMNELLVYYLKVSFIL
jgi:kinesin family member 13